MFGNNKRILKDITLLMVLIGSFYFTCNINSIINSFKGTNSHISNARDIIDESNINVKSGFKQIKLNMSLSKVKSLVGEPARIDESEYGFKWYVYNQYKYTLFMIGIDNNKVAGIFSNTDYNTSLDDITFDKDREYIRENYKTTNIVRGFKINMNIETENEYDVLKRHGNYLTIFYDIHKDDKISSFELIKEQYKRRTTDDFFVNKFPINSLYYNERLKESFENQMCDLINSTREKNGLERLYFDKESASNSARKHAFDMNKNNYFSHDNLKGETPFDRMKNEGVDFFAIGENIARGHLSSIYAHEALMNSEGHRKNILYKEYNKVGIGIDFGGEFKTYYVQNFYSD